MNDSENRVYEINMLSSDLEVAQKEIDRLRAGGCARNQSTTQFCAEAVALQNEIDRLNAENTRLREALEKIAALDVPRPVAARWWGDGRPSKHDQCRHSISM